MNYDWVDYEEVEKGPLIVEALQLESLLVWNRLDSWKFEWAAIREDLRRKQIQREREQRLCQGTDPSVSPEHLGVHNSRRERC